MKPLRCHNHPVDRVTPCDEYARRLGEHRRAETRFARNHVRVGNARLAAFAAAALIAWLTLRAGWFSAWFLVLPALAFVALVVVHERVIRSQQHASRAVAWYERGIARLEDRWAGGGEQGDGFRREGHLYADDLDLFGRGSLFELLCTARTFAGQSMLAAWLLDPAPPGTVRARQDAVRELAPRIDLREDIAVIGIDVRSQVDADTLIAWARAPRVLPWAWPRALLPLLAAGAVLALVAWLSGTVSARVLVLLLAVNALLGGALRRRVVRVLHAAAEPARELVVLASILDRLSRESFTSDRLQTLSATLTQTGVPMAAVRRLSRVVELHDWEHNQIFAPIAATLLWGTQCAWAIEAWRARHGGAIAAWLDVVGEFEALSALGTYAYEHPSDSFPDIVDEADVSMDRGYVASGQQSQVPSSQQRAASGQPQMARADEGGLASDQPPATSDRVPVFDAIQLEHPLIPRAQSVANDVRLGPEPQVLVVSGSNMSGKSTLLRSVGISAVLALAGAPVRARSLRLSYVAIGATLRIQDSLQAGRSRFYAEITRVREVVDMARSARPLLFLFDELFHGTNSHDRVAGAEGVLRSLVDLGAIGLVTTHDLALAVIADRVAPRAHNVHFEDRLVDGEMRFDYVLRAGPVTRSNALALMRAVGLEVDDNAG